MNIPLLLTLFCNLFKKSVVSFMFADAYCMYGLSSKSTKRLSLFVADAGHAIIGLNFWSSSLFSDITVFNNLRFVNVWKTVELTGFVFEISQVLSFFFGQ